MRQDQPRKMIWGAVAIGREINRSGDYVRRGLARMPASPVHRVGRRYWAYQDELRDFFERLARTSHTNPLLHD